MRYFTPVPETLEELKKNYKKLCFQHHPDCGGDTEDMKQVNGEYSQLFEKLKDIHVNADGETYRKTTNETSYKLFNSLHWVYMDFI